MRAKKKTDKASVEFMGRENERKEEGTKSFILVWTSKLIIHCFCFPKNIHFSYTTRSTYFPDKKQEEEEEEGPFFFSPAAATLVAILLIGNLP